MSVSIHFGTVYKKVSGRCYTQGESLYLSKHLEFDLDYQQYLVLIKKLKEEFPNDFIEHN